MRLREALSDAAARLARVSGTPRLDAELLMAHALGISRESLLLGDLDRDMPAGFSALLARRMAHEPLAYITGHRDFWTIDLKVAPSVLIPRPDSETLIEAAVAYFGVTGPRTVLDLGTGSGALLLAALAHWPAATGLGVDISQAALEIARANANALGLEARARFARGNWAEGIADRFDLVLCNPPYVESDAVLPADVRDHEPASALFAGTDGLDDYYRLVPQLPALLNPGGMIAVEIGATQAAAVAALFGANGLEAEVRKDLGARDRAIVHFSLGLGRERG